MYERDTTAFMWQNSYIKPSRVTLSLAKYLKHAYQLINKIQVTPPTQGEFLSSNSTNTMRVFN